MLTQDRLCRAVRRSAREGSWDALLEEMGLAAAPAGRGLRDRLLGDPDAGATGAIGIALRRACELAFAPDAEVIGLVEDALTRRRPDGSFGSVAATACVVAALQAAADLVDWSDEPLASCWRSIAAAGLTAIEKAMMEPHAQPIDAAIVLSQCSRPSPALRKRLWEISNSPAGRRDPAAQALLRAAGLTSSRRAA